MEEHGAVTKHIAEESLSFEILACVLAFVDCVRLEGCKHKSDGSRVPRLLSPVACQKWGSRSLKACVLHSLASAICLLSTAQHCKPPAIVSGVITASCVFGRQVLGIIGSGSQGGHPKPNQSTGLRPGQVREHARQLDHQSEVLHEPALARDRPGCREVARCPVWAPGADRKPALSQRC